MFLVVVLSYAELFVYQLIIQALYYVSLSEYNRYLLYLCFIVHQLKDLFVNNVTVTRGEVNCC
jgi:hypothetical protein